MLELPKYKSHKTIHALKIAKLEKSPKPDDGSILTPSDKRYDSFFVGAEWCGRFKGLDDDLGYYVVYKDGYASWSPTKEFEEGYTKL